jgi:hypothetical protein
MMDTLMSSAYPLVTQRPLVATHTSCRAITLGQEGLDLGDPARACVAGGTQHIGDSPPRQVVDVEPHHRVASTPRTVP